MATSRNENIPTVSLPETLKRVLLVYDKIHQDLADKAIIASSMGYKGFHGTFYEMLASACQYKLLEMIGEQYKVSDSALEILLHSRGSTLRTKAIERVAFPRLFGELRQLYKDALPDNNRLKAFFVEKGHSQYKAGDAARAYRETVEFINEENEYLNGGLNTEISGHSQLIWRRNPSDFASGDSSLPSMRYDQEESPLSWRIAPDCEVQIGFKGTATQEALQKLISLLQLSKEDYPSRS